MNAAPSPALATLATLALLASSAAAQRPDALVEGDLAFAEGLASRYHYTDLAERVLADVERGGVSAELEERLALARCSVLESGARYEGDPSKRLELHAKAIGAYEDFLEQHPYSDLVAQGERAFVDLTNRYGVLLEDALQDAVGEEAEALRETIKTVLDSGLDRVQGLIESLDRPDLSPSERNELHRFLLGKGQMLTTRAKIAEDGTFYFARAEETLEGLTLAAGDTSAAGLQAFLQLAKVKSAEGEYADAAEFAAYVVDFAVPMDPEARATPAWRELAQQDRQRRWDIVQIAMPELLGAYVEGGQTAQAIDAALYYYNTWKSEAFDLGPLGWLSLLSVAHTLLDAGGSVGGTLASGDLQWFPTAEEMAAAGFKTSRNARSALELALTIAQNVNDANKGNVLQVRAQRLISEAIDRPGVEVSVDVLFEAAEGEYNARDFERALAGYKRMLRALSAQDEATRVAQMPRALNGVGRSLERLDRSLEAAMAFREAATAWKGDPEYQRENADGFYQSIRNVRAGVGGDKLVEELYLQAEGLAAEAAAGGGAGEIHWRRGERQYADKDYAGARAEYLQVDPSDDAYEKALMKAALCRYKAGEEDAARQEFSDYLRQYAPDPAHVVTTKGKIEARAQASAMATYYLGLMARKDERWDDVVSWLGKYDADFGDQGDYAPAAMRILLGATIAQGDMAAMRDVLERMTARYAGHPQVGPAAAEASQALVPLIEAARAKKDAAEVARLVRERAGYLRVSNAASSPAPYGNLRAESLLWLELGDWTSAELALRAIADAYGSSKEYGDQVASSVLPDLGLVLLEQKRVPEAFDVLDPLVPDPDADEDTRRPSSDTVRRWCRAVCGWVEGDATTIVEVPGVGDAETIEDATRYWLQLTSASQAAGHQYDCEWYDLKFQTFYAYYRWSALDSKKLGDVKGYVEEFRIKSTDPEFKSVAEKCGDDVLRKRFLWLWDKVR